jgi:hypothetical protein
MKRTITVFVLGTLLGAALMGTAQPRQAAAQGQKAAAPAPTPASAQPDRLAALEARISAMDERCEQAYHDTEYVKQMQAGVEAYYEKAFNTQVLTLSIFGLLITVILGLASMFGFGVFDKKIDMEIEKANAKQNTIFEQRLRETTSKLHDDNQSAVATAGLAQEKVFEQRLQDQVSKLQDENAKKLAETIEGVQQRVQFNSSFVKGIAFAGLQQNEDAVDSFREAVDSYLRNTAGGVTKEECAVAIKNTFVGIYRLDKDKFTEAARLELKSGRLSGLTEEIALAAAEFPPLAEAMKPDPPPAPEPSPTPEAQPTTPPTTEQPPPPPPEPSTEPPQQPPPASGTKSEGAA